MESALEAILDKLASGDGVLGVLLADEHGLCLGARGVAKPASAGFVASIATHAYDLQQQNSAPTSDYKSQFPTVCVETTDSIIIIRNEGVYTLALFKEKQ